MRSAPRAPRIFSGWGPLVSGVSGVLSVSGVSGVLGAALALGVQTRPLFAGVAGITTRVRCPALAESMRSEFEARAQVDLSLRSVGEGELEVTCDALQAMVSWRPRTGGTFRRSVQRVVTPAALVDALLVAVAGLAAEGAALHADVEVSESPDGLDEEQPREKSVQPPATAAPAPEESPGERAGDDESPPRSRRPFSLGLSLGGEATLFSTAPGGALGSQLGVVIGLPSDFVGSAVADYAVGWGAGTSEIGVQMYGASAFVSRWLGTRREFELGLGLSAGTVRVSARAPYAPAVDSKGYAGPVVRGRYGWELGSFRWAVGPEVRMFVSPVAVFLDNTQIYEMPYFAAGISLDVTARMEGPLW